MIRIEIPQFIHRIRLSNKQKPKYFEKGKTKKIPKKYHDPAFYRFEQVTVGAAKKTLLIDRRTGKRVIANPIAINNARYLVIGANLLYSGVHPRVRMKMVEEIKNCMRPYVKGLPVFEHPVRIIPTLYMSYKLPNTTWGNWDIGNMMFVYGKVFEDLLKEEGKYKDDNVIHLTHTATGGRFVPVENYEDRKLVYTICYDRREQLRTKEDQ